MATNYVQHPPALATLLATAIRLDMAAPAPSTQLTRPEPGPAVRSSLTTPLDSVLKSLTELGTASPKEIRLHLGVPRTTVARALKALESAGAVRATGKTQSRRYVAVKMEAAA